MSRRTVLIVMAVLLGLWAVYAWACGEGCEAYRDACACQSAPERPVAVRPSRDVAPRSGRPSYEAVGVHADTSTSLADQDARWDREKAEADRQGKRAAGLIR